jgi:ribose 1,5-bisphosphate isomerase
MVQLLHTTEQPPALPPKGQHLFEQIFSGEFLGASRNIRMINDMFCAVAEEWPAGDPGLVRTLLDLGDFVRRHRGKNTPAIGNAIGLFLKDLHALEGRPQAEIAAEIDARRADFNAGSLARIDAIAEVGANLLEGCATVMLFDYSSSVQAIVNKVADRGRRLHVIVPESRVLDGGRAFVNESTARGHQATYILDMAFTHFMRQCDAVLIGVETLFANGDTWNTIGSYPVALVARQYHVPFYVPTELIKIDPRSYLGLSKELIPDDFGEMLGRARLKHPDQVDTRGPEFDRVPGELITAYITPQGVLLPQHIYAEARRFLADLGLDPLA